MIKSCPNSLGRFGKQAPERDHNPESESEHEKEPAQAPAITPKSDAPMGAEIVTERLILRPVSLQDAEDLWTIRSHPDVAKQLYVSLLLLSFIITLYIWADWQEVVKASPYQRPKRATGSTRRGTAQPNSCTPSLCAPAPL